METLAEIAPVKRYVLSEVYNTRSLHLGNGVANMSFATNLFLDGLIKFSINVFFWEIDHLPLP